MLKRLKVIAIVFCVVFGMSCFAVNSFDNSRLPGNSIADYRLQMDTLFPVFVVVTVKMNKKCKNISVIDTELVSMPEYKKKKGNKKYASSPWEELWTVKACRKNVKVPITFIPYKNGTSYAISQDKIEF